MASRTFFAAFALSTAVLATAPAGAQQPSEPPAAHPGDSPAGAADATEEPGTTEVPAVEPEVDPARERARAHFERAVTLMEGEDWEAALIELQRSLEAFPTRSALFNRGMCLKALFRYVEAMGTFEEFLQRHRDEADPDQLQRVADVVRELRGLLATITVEVNVAGAEILVDGRRVGTSPLLEPVTVASGPRTVAARREGWSSAEEVVAIAGGEHRTVELELLELGRSGTLAVDADVPAARVELDGLPIGATPYRGVVAAGEHRLRVSAPEREAVERTVTVVAGEESAVRLVLEESGGAHPAWFWTMIGITAAGTVGTAMWGAYVLVQDDRWRNELPRKYDTWHDGRAAMVVADLCLGVAAAAAVTALVLGFTTNWGDDEDATEGGDEDAAGALSAGVGSVGDGWSLSLGGRF